MAPKTSVEWPSEKAKQAKLYIPQNYDPYQKEDAPAECFLRYDKSHGALVVARDSDEEILDIIDIDDLIGAAIEVQLLGSGETTEPRVTNAAFRNTPGENGPSSPVDAGIFESLQENKDKVFTIVNPSSDDNAPSSAIPFDSQASAVLSLFVYPRKDPSKESLITSCTGRTNTQPVKVFSENTGISEKKLLHRYPHHRRLTIAPAEDFSIISEVVQAIRKLARPSAPKADRLLVLVNPFSGRKKGLEVYQNDVAPMLEQAGIDFDFLVTDHAGHAQELMAPRETTGTDGIDDVSKYSGLVLIGGDGSVYEAFQGIKNRPDCDKILKNLRLGHIGAGTSNGLSASLAHASQEHNTATDYAFIVAKGKTIPMDLSRYETKSKDYLSFLTFSWAFIADVDIESEVLRWLGWLRMDVYSLWRVINLRSYRAKLTYLPPSANKLESMVPLDQPLPAEKGWETIEDDFSLFWVSQVTHAGENIFNHPNVKPDDGLFHIFIVRSKVSRVRLAMILLGLEHGSHVGMEGVEFIECTSYRLEPITQGSFNDLDGEVIESGPVQGIVLPGIIQAYCNL